MASPDAPELPNHHHHLISMTHRKQPGAVEQPQAMPQPMVETKGKTPPRSEDFFVSAVRTFCVSVDTRWQRSSQRRCCRRTRNS
jgi:hypothetical protein